MAKTRVPTGQTPPHQTRSCRNGATNLCRRRRHAHPDQSCRELRGGLGRVVGHEGIGNVAGVPGLECLHRLRNRSAAAIQYAVEMRDDAADRRISTSLWLCQNGSLSSNICSDRRRTSADSAISAYAPFMSCTLQRRRAHSICQPFPRANDDLGARNREKRQQRNRGAAGIRQGAQLV